MKLRRLCLTLTAFVFGSQLLNADILILKNGEKKEGNILEERPDAIRMKYKITPKIWDEKDFPRADIQQIIKQKPEEIEISTTGNRLQISGKRDHEHENTTDQVYTYERQYGSFVRTFTLPAGVDADHAKSELKDGVLTLVIPKKAEAQPKKISITAAEPAKS